MTESLTTLVDCIAPSIEQVIAQHATQKEIESNPYPMIWGRTLAALYTALLEMASSETVTKISSFLDAGDTPDIQGMLEALDDEPRLYPFLIERLSRNTHWLVDCSDETAAVLQEMLLGGALALGTTTYEGSPA